MLPAFDYFLYYHACNYLNEISFKPSRIARFEVAILYISSLVLHIFCNEIIELNSFLSHSMLTNCINLCWLHNVILFFTKCLCWKRYGMFPSDFSKYIQFTHSTPSPLPSTWRKRGVAEKKWLWGIDFKSWWSSLTIRGAESSEGQEEISSQRGLGSWGLQCFSANVLFLCQHYY